MARLIDADALKALFDEQYDDAFMQFHTRANKGHWESYSIGINWGRNTIADAPTVDATEVVRCKDCDFKIFDDECKEYYCNCAYGLNGAITDNTFCSYGERRTDVQITD